MIFITSKDYKTGSNPYEGHYLHSNVEVDQKTENVLFYRGDYVIYTNQASNRYIIETLEPQAPDAFFAWNFFDGILQRKEYFSSYVFEDLAVEILKKNPQLQESLDRKLQSDSTFASNPRHQLRFYLRKFRTCRKEQKSLPSW